MTPALMIALGGLGALARYEIGGAVQRSTKSAWPLGTAAVNLSGALLAGFVAGMSDITTPGMPAAAALGFLGGYTTFSTWMVESVYLAAGGRRTAVALTANLAGLLVAGIAGVGAGIGLGGLL